MRMSNKLLAMLLLKSEVNVLLKYTKAKVLNTLANTSEEKLVKLVRSNNLIKGFWLVKFGSLLKISSPQKAA